MVFDIKAIQRRLQNQNPQDLWKQWMIKQPAYDPKYTAIPDVGPVAGMLKAGNIDLTTRPKVKNKDGSVSTVRSITVDGDNGNGILLPTVIGNQVVSNQDAINHYLQSGENLGTFNNSHNADVYAQLLHRLQSKLYGLG